MRFEKNIYITEDYKDKNNLYLQYISFNFINSWNENKSQNKLHFHSFVAIKF